MQDQGGEDLQFPAQAWAETGNQEIEVNALKESLPEMAKMLVVFTAMFGFFCMLDRFIEKF